MQIFAEVAGGSMREVWAGVVAKGCGGARSDYNTDVALEHSLAAAERASLQPRAPGGEGRCSGHCCVQLHVQRQ